MIMVTVICTIILFVIILCAIIYYKKNKYSRIDLIPDKILTLNDIDIILDENIKECREHPNDY